MPEPDRSSGMKKDNYRNTLCLDGKTVLSSRFAPQIDPLITACTAAPMEAM